MNVLTAKRARWPGRHMGDAWGQAQPPSQKGHLDCSKFITKQLRGSGSCHSRSPSPQMLDPGKLSWTGSRGDGQHWRHLTSTHHIHAGDAVEPDSPSGTGQELRVQGHCHLMFLQSRNIWGMPAPVNLRGKSWGNLADGAPEGKAPSAL